MKRVLEREGKGEGGERRKGRGKKERGMNGKERKQRGRRGSIMKRKKTMRQRWIKGEKVGKTNGC